MNYTTYIDLIRPNHRLRARFYNAACILGFSFLIALSAQFSFRLPFSPVPLTAQTLAVLSTGVILGSRRGALAVLAYLSQGVLGLPVFAGGMAGIVYLLGPTGGYLLGFVAAAYLTGLLAERGFDRRIGTALVTMLIGNLAIYLIGLPWLSIFVGLKAALPLGLYPFIIGDAMKIMLAGLLLPMGWRLVNKNK
jgi:biotin transport system substrate-specific component